MEKRRQDFGSQCKNGGGKFLLRIRHGGLEAILTFIYSRTFSEAKKPALVSRTLLRVEPEDFIFRYRSYDGSKTD